MRRQHGAERLSITGDGLKTFIDRDIEKWRKVVKQKGLTAD